MAQGQVGEPVDRGRGVAELVRGSRRDLAEVRQVPGERDPRLQPPHLRHVREESQHSEEAAVASGGRSRGHADDPFLFSAPPADFAAVDGHARGQDRRDHVGELRDLFERAGAGLAADLPRDGKDLPTRFVQFDDRSLAVHREKPGRKVSGERMGRDLQVVRPFLLQAGEPRELLLLLRESRDRRLEPRDHEVAFVGGRAFRRLRLRSGAGRRQQAFVRSQKRAQIKPGEYDERGPRKGYEHLEAARPGSKRAALPGIEPDGVEASARRGDGYEKRRLALPFVDDAPRRGPRGRKLGRGLEIPPRAALTSAGAVVERDEDDIALRRGALEALGCRLGGSEAPQNLRGAPFRFAASPCGRRGEEPERHQVDEEDQQQRDPEE